MLGALIIVGVLIGICAWVAIRTVRVPKKPDHERAPERFRDPAETAYRSGGDFGGMSGGGDGGGT